jgi:hypothetical protein
MTTTALIEPPRSADALGTQPRESHLPDFGERLAGLPPLLSIVPQAGPPLFVYLGFGVVLLLLLVPPITLLATLAAVALVVAAALTALVVVAGAILRAPFLLVRFLRGHPLRQFSLPVPHVRKLNARRV